MKNIRNLQADAERTSRGWLVRAFIAQLALAWVLAATRKSQRLQDVAAASTRRFFPA